MQTAMLFHLIECMLGMKIGIICKQAILAPK